MWSERLYARRVFHGFRMPIGRARDDDTTAYRGRQARRECGCGVGRARLWCKRPRPPKRIRERGKVQAGQCGEQPARKLSQPAALAAASSGWRCAIQLRQRAGRSGGEHQGQMHHGNGEEVAGYEESQVAAGHAVTCGYLIPSTIFGTNFGAMVMALTPVFRQ